MTASRTAEPAFWTRTRWVRTNKRSKPEPVHQDDNAPPVQALPANPALSSTPKIKRGKFLGLLGAACVLPALSPIAVLSRRPRKPGILPPAEKSACRIFLDESGGRRDRYRIAGCLAVDKAFATPLLARVESISPRNRQIRWHTVDSGSYEMHKDLVDLLLAEIAAGRIDFAYAINPAEAAPLGGDSVEIGYSDAATRLLLHYSSKLRDTRRLYVHPVKRIDDGSPEAPRRSEPADFWQTEQRAHPAY